MSELHTFPVLALEDVVVLPGMVVPIELDDAARAAVDAARTSNDDRLLVAPRLEDRYATYGVVATIQQVGRLPGGGPGAVIQASLLTIANAANFWIKGRTPVVAFMLSELQSEALRFPLTIFPAGVRLVLTFGLPLAFASFVPAQILTGRLDPWWLAGPPLAAAVCAYAAVRIFNAGVRAYDSAGN